MKFSDLWECCFSLKQYFPHSFYSPIIEPCLIQISFCGNLYTLKDNYLLLFYLVWFIISTFIVPDFYSTNFQFAYSIYNFIDFSCPIFLINQLLSAPALQVSPSEFTISTLSICSLLLVHWVNFNFHLLSRLCFFLK